MEETYTILWKIFESGGSWALAIFFIYSFMTGQILSKTTYEKLMEEILSTIINRVLSGMDDMIKDTRNDISQLKDEVKSLRYEMKGVQHNV